MMILSEPELRHDNSILTAMIKSHDHQPAFYLLIFTNAIIIAYSNSSQSAKIYSSPSSFRSSLSA